MSITTTISAFDILDMYGASITSEVHSASNIAALRRAEEFTGRLRAWEKEGPDVPTSTVLEACESLVSKLPSGSQGRARLVHLVLIAADQIQPEALRTEYVAAFTGKESSCTIAAALDRYQAQCRISGQNPTIVGLEELCASVTNPKAQRILCGLELLERS